ncbi:metallophosphoesterase [Paludibacter sp. 221]|uniref:metallophosphoesterase family protein n=1 Tax=Paludibacter sp. 221 TaxID=2302939 RepID=UPI0013D86253|nr:metallophosphoesterase family protein [Paludibacter sp. 221]NDV47091.1 metallophosphoesterase [Paludibacter sp. 221]
MKRIGLLSDTHGILDERVFKYFDTCDEVWHAGDWGSLEVVNRLRQFKPLRGVWGNIDSYEIRSIFPQHNRFMCEDVKVWITHIGGYPGKYDPSVRPDIFRNPPNLFISGHSHILKVKYDKTLGLLHMNPGAAGKYGFHQVQTLLRFEVDGDKIQELEVIELKAKQPE